MLPIISILFFCHYKKVTIFKKTSLTGIGEVVSLKMDSIVLNVDDGCCGLSQVLLPLDALKIKRQVNPEAFRGRGVVRIFMEEGTTLYRGWGWTMARNAPGSFAVRVSHFHIRTLKKKLT